MQAFRRGPITLLIAALALPALIVSACKEHHAGHGDHDHTRSPVVEAARGPTATLAPAEGARVKILEPGTDQVFSGDTIPLRFELAKGKRGQHVHAYIDGELMGMFKSTSGTLTGVKPGKHTLELRVVTSDHNVELEATDRITFSVK